MNYLHELPVIFVNYTLGSGGWFLAALIQKWENPNVDVVIDNKGSGHANVYIRHINNFYRDYMHSDLGQAVVHDIKWDQFDQKQRIEYLQQSVKISKSDSSAIVISLHCANIDLFITAFPTAKFICINIDQDHILQCRYNFLFKAISSRPELFHGMAKEHNKNLDTSLHQIQNLNKQNFEALSWVDPEIVKFIPKKIAGNKNIMNVYYKDYLWGNEYEFLDSIAEFLNVQINQEQFNETVDMLVNYRLSQPRLPI